MKKLLKLAKKILLWLIRIYQKTLSPDHGLMSSKYPFGVCKYYPTCSEYAYQSIEKHGLLKGGLISGKRVLRCNPFSQGGYDPIPKK